MSKDVVAFVIGIHEVKKGTGYERLGSLLVTRTEINIK